MLVVTVELWPGGDASRRSVLGIAEIANTGKGSDSTGEYVFRLLKKGGRSTWKQGRLAGFPRLKLGAWDLLYRCLREVVADRNRPDSPVDGSRDQYDH